MPEEAPGRIIVYGDVIDDVVVVPRTAIQPDTDTPSDIRFLPGGSAANTAAWLGHLGANVDFVGRVGEADLPRHRALLETAGVNAILAGDPDRPTGTIVVLVQGQQRSMLTERGANAGLDPALVSDAQLHRAAWLHLTGHSLFGAPDPEPMTALVRRAVAAGVRVSVDPGSAGFLSDYGAERFLAAIAGASVVLPSLAEARILTGLDDPRDMAAALSAAFDIVVLTLGADGAIVATGASEPVAVPAVPTEVTDPTGAGDAFTAGFIHSFLHTGDAVEAARAGAGLAALAVSALGGRPAG